MSAVEVAEVDIATLKPSPYNPRNISPKALRGLRASVKRFGLVQEIVVNKRSGLVVSGHQRLKVLEELGEKRARVAYVDLSDAEEKALNVTLNNPGVSGEFSKSIGALIGEIKLSLPALDFDELRFDELADPPAVVEDEVPEPPKVPVTKPGDLWVLGRHRVLCGDATKAGDVGPAVDGKLAGLVFTDPPYGVGKDIRNDELTGANFDEFNADWISVLPVSRPASLLCYHSTRTFPSVLDAARGCGWSFERMLWYYRPDKFPAHSWKHWMMVSQAIMIFAMGDPEYADAASDQDCYRHMASELGKSHSHPTEKMVGHCAAVMSHFAATILFDPFLGSGTTLIAAEQLDRACYGLEIEPAYCDVIVERWQNLTGQKAKRAA